MSPSYKATLLPRLVILLGAILIALKTFLNVDILPDPIQTTVGGGLGLIGVVWFIFALRKARKQDHGR